MVWEVVASGVGDGNLKRKIVLLMLNAFGHFLRSLFCLKFLVSVGLIVIDGAFECWRELEIEALGSLTLEQFINASHR